MNILRVFLAVALLIAGTSSAVHAQQTLSEKIWWRSSHNKLSAEVNRVLGVTASDAAPSGAGATAKGFAVSNQANQWPDLRAKTPAPLPASMGRPVIDVQARVVPSSAAGAIGRFARKAIPLLGTGVALYELGQELGFGLDNNGGTLVVSKDTPLPSGYDGKEWMEQTAPLAWSKTRQQACDAYAEYRSLSDYPYTPGTWVCVDAYFSAPAEGAQRMRVRNVSGGFNSDNLLTFRTDPSPPSTDPQPSTLQELEDAIAAKSGWPTSSAISRALADAINSGEGVSTQSPTVTGPASSPGPVKRTVNPGSNTTTTSTTTHNHTYNGDTITTTTTTTNVTVNNTTNEVVDSSTTTEEPVIPDSPEPDVSFTDKPLPAIPKLYEPKYPEGLVGVWNEKKSQLDSAPLVALVEDLMPNVGSGGSCPVWTIPLNFGFFNAGTLDFSVPCYVWDFAKVVIIVSALMLARRLVFGG